MAGAATPCPLRPPGQARTLLPGPPQPVGCPTGNPYLRGTLGPGRAVRGCPRTPPSLRRSCLPSPPHLSSPSVAPGPARAGPRRVRAVVEPSAPSVRRSAGRGRVCPWSFRPVRHASCPRPVVTPPGPTYPEAVVVPSPESLASSDAAPRVNSMIAAVSETGVIRAISPASRPITRRRSFGK